MVDQGVWTIDFQIVGIEIETNARKVLKSNRLREVEMAIGCVGLGKQEKNYKGRGPSRKGCGPPYGL